MIRAKEAIGVFYDLETNRFMDEDGQDILNIFELVSANDLYMFKKTMEDMTVPHRTLKNVVVELYWPDNWDWEAEWDGDPETLCNYCNERNYPLCDYVAESY